MSRAAVIGLDAVEWTLVEQMLADGRLPHLARIRDRSAAYRLRVDNSLWLERIWEVALLGMQAFPNTAFDPSTYAALARGARSAPPLYARTGSPSVVTLDVPYLSPALDVRGACVTDWCLHAFTYPRAARPRGLLDEIEAEVGPHPGRVSQHGARWHRPRSIEALARDMIEGARLRPAVSRFLQTRFPDWNLLLLMASEGHSAGELMWHGVDPEHPLHGLPLAASAGRGIRQVYEALDESVGAIVADLPDDAFVVVASAHGMTPNGSDVPATVLLPELLYRLEFGKPYLRESRAGGRHGGPVVPRPWQWWVSYMEARFPGSSLGLIRRRLPDAWAMARQRLGLRRPASAGAETDRSFDEIGEPFASTDGLPAKKYAPFWPRMRAFALPSYSHGQVRINLAGRERDGIVAVDDYPRVCDEVVGWIRECVDPRTGRSIVGDVIRPRAGDPLDPDEPEPDVVIVWDGCADSLTHPRAGTIGPYPFHRTGGHSSRGFAFVSGPGIEPGDRGERSVIDLPPTIVGLLGQTLPPDAPGTSLLEPIPAAP